MATHRIQCIYFMSRIMVGKYLFLKNHNNPLNFELFINELFLASPLQFYVIFALALPKPQADLTAILWWFRVPFTIFLYHQ